MTLSPGTRLGPYEIAAPLGAGGMGEVYRARDTKLGREVALKLLPEAFAADGDRLARFRREAQVLASLNHPHIAAIHGLEESDGHLALVLELVEGETLDARLRRGPIPIDEALAIARQIAEGLEAAHERGIIHRDLKPANIKVTPEGNVKLLDFGLAKAIEGEATGEADVSQSPTLSRRMTEAGLILGTAAYMSPEQARGKPVDKRTDIWSFGVVLFEMLTGKRLFAGETVSDTLAAVLKTDPDWSALPPAVPHAVRRVLETCLRKDPRRRLRDMGDVQLFLDAAPAASAPARARGSWRTHAAWASACLTVAALAAWTAATLTLPPPPPVRRFQLRVPEGVISRPNSAAISPDGTRLAYTGGGRLWIHELRALEPREVPGTAGAMRPFWSSDSQWVGYGIGRRLWKAPVAGGAAVAIADLPEDFTPAAGGAWSPDGRIVLTTGFTGLLGVSDRGGDLRVVLPLDPETDVDFHEASALPDGRGVIFYVHARPGRPGTLEVFDGKRRKVVVKDESPGLVLDHPVYSSTGHLLYRRSPTNAGIWAVPFSLDSLETTGSPFLVVAGRSAPSVSREGTLAYSAGGSEIGLPARLTWVDRSGAVVGTVGEPEAGLSFAVLSPDGRRIAVATVDGVVWVYDVASGTRARLTLDPGLNEDPGWFPDGTRLVHVLRPSIQSGLPRIVARGVDGAGASSDLAEGQKPTVTADGRWLVYQTYGGRADILRVDIRERSGPEPIVNDPKASEQFPSVSPDVRWLAFTSDASGRNEVYVASFPDGGRRWQVSATGGARPRWRSDGRELYYLDGDSLMAVSVAASDALSMGTPTPLFSALRLSAGFDVARDGTRFLIIRSDEDRKTQTVTVVQNWFAEFKER